jgi:hypothetical protein
MTGSFYNNLMAKVQGPTPELGMGVTELCWSDRNPYTIIGIVNEKTLIVQADDYVRTDNYGMSDAQDYTYIQNPNNRTATITLRKNGSWVTQGSTTKSGTHWFIGKRQKYHDFTF